MTWLAHDADVHGKVNDCEYLDDCICEDCDPNFCEDDLYADEESEWDDESIYD